MTTTMETRAKTYQLEIAIEAPREAVWRSLVEETNGWWLPDFHMAGEGSVVTLDATAGGQLVERQENGGSLLWYTVQMCTPGESLHLVGHLAAPYGGPATTMLSLTLRAEGETTVLAVQDSLVGAVSDGTVDSLEQGWRQLFGEGLKPHAERG